MDNILEIIADSVESLKAAQDGGANRIELCSNLLEGGVTPSFGLIKKALEASRIPVYVMIRPRGGDFVYSEEEFKVMKEDVARAVILGADGIVSGVLNSDNTIDLERTRELIYIAKPAKFTFHRAFDFVPNPLEAIDQLVEIEAERILTSGQTATAIDGALNVYKFNKKAAGRIKIMIGGGINSNNVQGIANLSQAREFHSSAKVRLDVKKLKLNLGRGEQGGFTRYGVSKEEVKRLRMRLG